MRHFATHALLFAPAICSTKEAEAIADQGQKRRWLRNKVGAAEGYYRRPGECAHDILHWDEECPGTISSYRNVSFADCAKMCDEHPHCYSFEFPGNVEKPGFCQITRQYDWQFKITEAQYPDFICRPGELFVSDVYVKNGKSPLERYTQKFSFCESEKDVASVKEETLIEACAQRCDAYYGCNSFIFLESDPPLNEDSLLKHGYPEYELTAPGSCVLLWNRLSQWNETCSGNDEVAVNGRLFSNDEEIETFLGCGFDNKQNWRGPAGKENLPNQPIKNVESACKCQALCDEKTACEYWSYNKEQKNCWQKKNFESIENSDDNISGWRTDYYQFGEIGEDACPIGARPIFGYETCKLAASALGLHWEPTTSDAEGAVCLRTYHVARLSARHGEMAYMICTKADGADSENPCIEHYTWCSHLLKPGCDINADCSMGQDCNPEQLGYDNDKRCSYYPQDGEDKLSERNKVGTAEGYYRRPGECAHDDYMEDVECPGTISSYPNDSFADCAKKCDVHPHCYSFEFSGNAETSGFCQIARQYDWQFKVVAAKHPEWICHGWKDKYNPDVYVKTGQSPLDRYTQKFRYCKSEKNVAAVKEDAIVEFCAHRCDAFAGCNSFIFLESDPPLSQDIVFEHGFQAYEELTAMGSCVLLWNRLSQWSETCSGGDEVTVNKGFFSKDEEIESLLLDNYWLGEIGMNGYYCPNGANPIFDDETCKQAALELDILWEPTSNEFDEEHLVCNYCTGCNPPVARVSADQEEPWICTKADKTGADTDS